jgi:predicted GIY-YIG superfamily endonuclease
MYIVYLIQHSEDKSLYIGKTGNLTKRLEQHNSNQNISTSRKTGKWILIYAEAYRNKEDADMRERRLKAHGSGKHELYKRVKNSLL